MLAMYKTIKSYIYKERNLYDQEIIKKLDQAGSEKPKKSKISMQNGEKF